jgi:hypothetical protein
MRRCPLHGGSAVLALAATVGCSRYEWYYESYDEHIGQIPIASNAELVSIEGYLDLTYESGTWSCHLSVSDKADLDGEELTVSALTSEAAGDVTVDDVECEGDWSQVGGRSGPARVYGTYTIEDFVYGDAEVELEFDVSFIDRHDEIVFVSLSEIEVCLDGDCWDD